MKIIQRIRNNLIITCNDVNFLSATSIEFYIRQDDFFATYTPTVLDATTMAVSIPLADAKKLNAKHVVKVQFALTNTNGDPLASNVLELSVREFLKEAGYGS